jgi:glycerophosphoryl diester phosphodiesterase
MGVRAALGGAACVQVPESFGVTTVVTRRFVDAVHAAGVPVHVWTVNDPARMTRLLDLGVDGIVTDRADLMLAILRDRAPGLP